MKTNLYSIYDEKAKAYASPFTSTQSGQAIRSFSDLVQDPKTTLNHHPEDFSLYHIGYYDDDTSKIESLIPPAILAKGTEFTKSNDLTLTGV